MSTEAGLSLEKFLGKVEAEASGLSRSVVGLSKAVKRMQTAAGEGNLRDLTKCIEMVHQCVASLGREIERSKDSWHFNFEAYVTERHFYAELKQAANDGGLALYEHDGGFYCYPAIVTVNAKEQTVRIGRKNEKALRPSCLTGC